MRFVDQLEPDPGCWGITGDRDTGHWDEFVHLKFKS